MDQPRASRLAHRAIFSGFERRPGLHKLKGKCLHGHGFWLVLRGGPGRSRTSAHGFEVRRSIR